MDFYFWSNTMNDLEHMAKLAGVPVAPTSLKESNSPEGRKLLQELASLAPKSISKQELISGVNGNVSKTQKQRDKELLMSVCVEAATYKDNHKVKENATKHICKLMEKYNIDTPHDLITYFNGEMNISKFGIKVTF